MTPARRTAQWRRDVDMPRLRVALALVVVGLLLHLPSAIAVTPATFIVSAAGVPFVLAGVVLYLVQVVRVLRRKGAL